MESPVDSTLRNRIVRFYKSNPDEGLTSDDMFVKFCYKKTRWMLEDVLFEMQDSGILEYRNGLYCFVAEKPKGKSKKRWRPPKLRHKSIRIAPMWIAENGRTPFQRYNAPNYIGEDKVREFWKRVADGKSCELWCDTATGEKKIIGLYDKGGDGWVPMLRSKEGDVSMAMTNYSFKSRR